MKAPAFPPLSCGVRYGIGPNGERICTGARMGMSNTLPDPAQRSLPCKLRLVRLRWVDGDYIQNGAYFGARRLVERNPREHYGPALDWIFRAVGDCGDVQTEIFTRAKDRAEAKANVRAVLPGARFYR